MTDTPSLIPETFGVSPRETVRLARVSGVRLARMAVARLRLSDDPVPVLDRLIAELESQVDPLALPASLDPPSSPMKGA